MLRKTEPTEGEQLRMLSRLRKAQVTLDGRLIGPRVTVNDLLNLEVGDCLKFDYQLERQLDLLINGVCKWNGRVIEANNKRVFVVETLPTAQPIEPSVDVLDKG